MNNIGEYSKQIPIYITRSNLANNSTNLSRHKFLVAPGLTIEYLSKYLHLKLKLQRNVPIFLFVNNTLQSPTTLIADIYSKYKNIDGEINMIYSTELIMNNINIDSRFLNNII